MTAEQYLGRIKKIDVLIENKVKDYKRWIETAEGMGASPYRNGCGHQVTCRKCR